MTQPKFASIKLNDSLPPLAIPPITRQTLAVYCGASGDHNPIHVDIDFARESGLDDVIAHGMLVMAYMGRLITNWVPQSAIQSFDTRFQAMTRVGDAITATATIAEKFGGAGDQRVRLELSATDQRGEIKATGSAVVVLN